MSKGTKIGARRLSGDGRRMVMSKKNLSSETNTGDGRIPEELIVFAGKKAIRLARANAGYTPYYFLYELIAGAERGKDGKWRSLRRKELSLLGPSPGAMISAIRHLKEVKAIDIHPGEPIRLLVPDRTKIPDRHGLYIGKMLVGRAGKITSQSVIFHLWCLDHPEWIRERSLREIAKESGFSFAFVFMELEEAKLIDGLDRMLGLDKRKIKMGRRSRD
jgi:hypothetical protein